MAAVDALGYPQWSGATPPDYVAAYRWRFEKLKAMQENPALVAGALEYYRTRPIEFIEHWVTTFDPRNSGKALPARMPFIMFPRQKELVRFFLACADSDANGMVEKARDMGATWVACAFSVWFWRFRDGSTVGWGSRKADMVDRAGVPDSIFEKLRQIIAGVPPVFLPPGYDPREHSAYMKIVNPANGSSITGESGDNIGRGGRSSIYFKDESAFYPRPELIEAALGDNTRCQIDISSVNVPGNVFHRRREAAIEWRGGAVVPDATNLFVMDWRDHPAKTQEWYDAREKKAKSEGLYHVHAREVDRNYFAANEGVLIPGAWVQSAIDAHKKLGFDDEGGWCAGLDVADGGLDRNAWVARKGVILREASAWSERDTGVTARRAVDLARDKPGVAVQYDCIGVGSGVKAEINRLRDEDLLPRGVTFTPWNAGDAPQRPDDRVIPDDDESPLNKDFYANLKAQGWWQLRLRFERTHKAVTEGVRYSPDDLISIDGTIPDLAQLTKELSQPVRGLSARMKLLVEKTPEGTRSPNFADATMQAFWPIETSDYTLDHL